MSRIEKAALELHRIIWHNTGSTDEWPIVFKMDDWIHDQVVDALNELHDAIEEKHPGSSPWPIENPLP